METLLLLQYNNYFNRIIKKEPTLNDYCYQRNHKYLTGFNFNPNDGINTKQIINWSENWNPDYCIILDVDNNILSRWFITKQTRTRSKQFEIVLKRDSLSDFYDTSLNSPCFVEKATLTSDNPLIFNSEGMQLNKIKKSETLLSDKSKMSWLAVYYDKSSKSDLSGNFSTVNPASIGAVEIGTTLEESYFYQYIQNGYKKINSYLNILYVKTGLFDSRIYGVNKNVSVLNPDFSPSVFGSASLTSSITNSNDLLREIHNIYEDYFDTLETAIHNQFDEDTDFDDLIRLNGRLIKTSDNKYYQVRVTPLGNETNYYSIRSDNYSTLFTLNSTIIKPSGTFVHPFGGSIDNDTFKLSLDVQKYQVSVVQRLDLTGTYDFRTLGIEVQDAPYGVILLPFKSSFINDYNWKVKRFGQTSYEQMYNDFTSISMNIASDLIQRLSGANKIYDVQIIPYCALTELRYELSSEGTPAVYFNSFNFNYLGSSQVIYVKDGSDNILTFALLPSSINYTTNIYCENDIEDMSGNLDYLDYAEKVKVSNECDTLRLCSPNFNGIYEFSPAKNGGTANYYNVDVTLKPYTPYIHVNPIFSGLYGQDFNDPRGLICGGDFSLSKLNDTWQTYQQNNKNFQNVFVRQIDSMDFNHFFDTLQNSVQAVTGSVQGAMMGGIAGGVGGAIAGGVTSLLGGIADVGIGEARYGEQKDYFTDMHNYQLGNIQALANTLTKVDAFNNNNKIFPVLEYISCTEEERKIVLNKIRYDGMSVMSIGRLEDHLHEYPTFMKGQMIRINSDYDYEFVDDNIANDIYNEIKKGVYI